MHAADTRVHARKEGRVMVGGRRLASALISRGGAAVAGGASLCGGAEVAANRKPLIKAPPLLKHSTCITQHSKLHLFRVGASFRL